MEEMEVTVSRATPAHSCSGLQVNNRAIQSHTKFSSPRMFSCQSPFPLVYSLQEEIFASSFAAAAYLSSINFPKDKKVSEKKKREDGSQPRFLNDSKCLPIVH